MSVFITESALLTHGLKSISNERIYDAWDRGWKIAWVENGLIELDGIEKFLDFRRRAGAYKRINYFNFDGALEDKSSGALTASGTMRVCEMMGIPIAVTCGIGGLNEGEDIGRCNDLRALMSSDVSMVATAFKDFFDPACTISQFTKNGIEVFAKDGNWKAGYVFSPKTPGPLIKSADPPVKVRKKALYLNPIPDNGRIKDRGLLSEAVEYGREQEKAGKYLHPAVNAKIDELTEGYASELQLKSLVENIRWAQTFIE